jgi:spore coat protein A, manganese oxidase
MSLTRREAITLGIFGAGALLVPYERSVRAGTASRLAESSLPVPFTVPFAVPPVLAPVRSDSNADRYWLTMREQQTEIIPGFRTRVWGYNGLVPGPTIDVEQDRPVVVRMVNDLPTHPALGYRPNTSVHLHGAASLPQYDGYASDVSWPGEYKDYQWSNSQHARTLWYHDHGVHQTSSNVYMGLAGMYRLHDPVERSLPIPHGRYDVPLVVMDVAFDRDGELLWGDHADSGVFGDVILVNGRPWPAMPVERRKYRFRILNASITRAYRWELDSGAPLVVVGTDAGLVPVPQSVRQMRHAPAERYEVVIDFAQYPIGRRVVLLNRGVDNDISYENTDKVMAFDVVSDATSTEGNSIPDVLYPVGAVTAAAVGTATLAGLGQKPPGKGKPKSTTTTTTTTTTSTTTTTTTVPDPDPDPPPGPAPDGYQSVMSLPAELATATRRLQLVRQGGEWTINGETWGDVMASGFRENVGNPAVDAVEVWELHNDSGGWNHPLHIHLVDMRILDRVHDQVGPAEPPMPHERGPKDVIYVGENERVRVIARFGPHAGRYMVHCHNLAHEDHDMMHQFEVGAGGADPIMTAPAAPLSTAPPL